MDLLHSLQVVLGKLMRHSGVYSKGKHPSEYVVNIDHILLLGRTYTLCETEKWLT